MDKQLSIESTLQTMTVKEVSEALNVNSKTVLRAIKKLYPDIVQNGKITYLSEYQVTRIKEQIFKNAYLDSSVEVTTELEMSEMTTKVIAYHLEKVKSLTEKVEELKPKAVEYDRFMSADNVQTMNEVAKVLKIGPKVLMKLLREKGVLMSNNVPYQQYAHLFEVVFKPIPTGNNVPVTLVKPEGFKYISKKIIN